MCGIVGYLGPREAGPILLQGLSRLEYRGYDSVGVAVQNGRGVIVRKLPGRVAQLKQSLARAPLHGSSGIGHTRWATHGPPTERNAHPHLDCAGRIAVVHNGIIDNCTALRRRLEQTGHRFVSDTDTEVLAHLIEETAGETLEERVAAALQHVQGTYGIAVMHAEEPGKIVAARRGSPVLLGLNEKDGEYYIVSDASAVLEHTRAVVYLKDGDLAVLTRAGYRVLDAEACEQQRSVDALDWELDAIELSGYEHFMLKEIHEQPESVSRAMTGRLLAAGTTRLDGLRLTNSELRRVNRIVIVACGTSWHAALIGRHIIEQLAGVPVQVEYASEYHNHAALAAPGTLAVAISQSGETADTLEAMRAARASNSAVVGIVNVVGSTIAREADGGIYLHAGPEIGVASTKAFTNQVVALLLLGIHLAHARSRATRWSRALAGELLAAPAAIAEALALEPQIREIAAEYQRAANFLYLGRAINFPVALEGALKLKEISYIHAEGYPAAEMKHGPIALIDENMPVVFIAPNDASYGRVLANM